MKDWPLFLLVVIASLGAIVRYIEVNEPDFVVIMLALFAAGSFGAWLYATGRKDD